MSVDRSYVNQRLAELRRGMRREVERRPEPVQAPIESRVLFATRRLKGRISREERGRIAGGRRDTDIR